MSCFEVKPSIRNITRGDFKTINECLRYVIVSIGVTKECFVMATREKQSIDIIVSTWRRIHEVPANNERCSDAAIKTFQRDTIAIP